MKISTSILLLLTLSVAVASGTEIPSNIQKRILAYSPEVDSNGDGQVSIDELKVIYPTLPNQYQQRLISRIPGLAAEVATQESAGGQSENKPYFTRAALDPAEGRAKGYNAVFLGHSYFAPIVVQIEKHAKKLGLTNHRQFSAFAGGPRGAPGNIWNNPSPAVAQVKKMLESGNVELVALTSHYTGSTIADYSLWIDFALKHNPKTIFVIQAPWPQKQDKDFLTYSTEAKEIILSTRANIDQLRAKYPDTVFMCVPQAKWMVDLWQLHNDGKLPELTNLIAPTKKDTQAALFRDRHGHGAQVAVDEGVFLWLRVLYGTDLTTYDIPTKTQYDLKAHAQQIVDNEPYAQFPKL